MPDLALAPSTVFTFPATTHPLSMYLQNKPKIVCSRESFQEVYHFIEGSVPFLDMIVDHAQLEADSIKAIHAVFPKWSKDELELTQCKDGITNKLMKCRNLKSGEQVLIRAYGKKSDLIIDRPQELVNFVTLSFEGLSPPIYARFKNGFVYGYIEGKPLSKHDMGDPVLAKLIARNLAKWHKMEVPGEPAPRLFRTLKRWLEGLPQVYLNPVLQERWKNSGFTHEWIEKQSLLLEYKVIAAIDSPVVFCHNDLLSANIIDTGKDAMFIDYEYGAQNFRGFDIGNHFNEYAGLECEYDELYPRKEAQMLFLCEYLHTIKGSLPTESDLEKLYLEVNVFALTSHFFWGLWALIQASVSDIQFDYMGYAIKRFTRYKDTKQTWFDHLEQQQK